MRYLFNGLLFLLSVTSASAVWADTAPFDLAGPTLRVTVSRNGESLPIAEVPQLAAGDRIAVRADLPADQSSHYLLIAAFLRGSTNPPPDSWFFKSEPWKKRDRNGLVLTVPADAAQVVLFLAPETGGDFPTLRDAVQGRPGAFVRAAQELAQASLDHARLQAYLDAVRKTVPGDPERLSRITPLLARSLQIKVNSDCLEKMPSLQAPCLLQNQESLVLNDGHSNAITDALQGPGTDLALQLSATPQGGLGYYGPYIAAIRDVVGILSSLHTAKYQYLPALATVDGDGMGLVLNAAPGVFQWRGGSFSGALTNVNQVEISATDGVSFGGIFANGKLVRHTGAGGLARARAEVKSKCRIAGDTLVNARVTSPPGRTATTFA